MIVIVYNHGYCLQSMLLFTIFVIVYNQCFCLQSMFLFTINVLVYNQCFCLQLFTIISIPLWTKTLSTMCVQMKVKKKNIFGDVEFTDQQMEEFKEAFVGNTLSEEILAFCFKYSTLNRVLGISKRQFPKW